MPVLNELNKATFACSGFKVLKARVKAEGIGKFPTLFLVEPPKNKTSKVIYNVRYIIKLRVEIEKF